MKEMLCNKEGHCPEMEAVINEYRDAVDVDIFNFVQDVMSGRDVVPLTVGFVTKRMAETIQKLTGVFTLGNRIVLGADDVRHIINRHGPQGKADHSMQDIKDIARLSYVLANYDDIEYDGGVSNLYKTKDGRKAPQVVVRKRIDGTYYVVEVVSDSSRCRNIVSTVYLKKAKE